MILALLLALQEPGELEAFKVAEGYEIGLFASEKEGVVKPVQIRWDERGRLWVTCSPSYPQIGPGERADDRIVVLTDSDQDGRADRGDVFARGLTMPLGLELGRGGVFTADGPDLVHLSDTDGDGRADLRRVVLRGFYTGDSHQSINNFVWGPGGELLMCQGLHAYGTIETPWGVERLRQAGVWRLRERRLRLDAFLGEDMGPQNPYGIAFDDWGRPVLVAGNGQGVYDLLPAMIRTNHYLRFPQIWDKQGIKFGGADLVGTAGMPDDAQGQLVSGSFMNNSVYRFRLSEDGSGQRAKDLPPLVVTTRNTFRPVDAKMGPDGALYLADWYNPIIGHYQASLRHPGRDKTRGRIWRIAAKGRGPVRPPDLASMDSAQLLGQLGSPERWVRYQAKRLLFDRNPAELFPAAERWIAGTSDERLLVEALGLHEAHERVEPGLLARLLAAAEPRARAYAAGVIAHWQDRLEAPLDLLARAARDEHPRVRLAAVVSSAYVPDPRAIEVAASVLDRPADRFIAYALTQAVHALKPVWRPAFDAGRLSFDGRAERLEFVLRADGSKDLLASVNRLLSGELPAASRAGLLGLLARIGEPADLRRVFDEAERGGSRALLEELAAAARTRRVKPTGDFSGPLGLLAARGEPLALVLAGLWDARGLERPLLDAARGKDVALRSAAIEALAEWKEAAALKDLAASDPLAAAALARVDLAAAAPAAAKLLAKDPEGLVSAFLGRPGGSEALAAALGGVAVGRDAAKLGLRAMSTAGRQDEALRTALWTAAGITTAAPEYSAEFAKALAEEALAEGDPARGETVFRGTLTNCLSCHAVGGAGGRAGPDLAPVGTALPPEILVESVLWPNRQVKEGFGAVAVMTDSDRILQGYKAGEDKAALSLRDPHTDEVTTIPAARIKARKDVGSIMPDGLANGLTRPELRDLIRFLAELGKPGPWRVSERPFVRRWLVPAGPAEGDTMPSRWIPRFSTVSGELPAADVPESGWLRFEAEVLTPGAFTLQGVEAPLWVDGVPVAGPLRLERGLRALTLRLPRRAGVSAQLLPAAPAEARLRGLGDPK